MQYRADVDGLRAIAVLAVVAFHAFPKAVTGGFVGVDVFFVVSGFLITGLILNGLEDGTFSFLDFYARRARRIFPALAIVLAGSLALGWFALLANEYQMLSKHAAAAAAFLVNTVFIREAGYFDASAELKPLLHLWSLSIEEQFYLLWPLALVLVFRNGFNVITVIAAVSALSFLFNIAQVHADPDKAFFALRSRLWELGLGCLLAYQTRHGQTFDDVLRRLFFNRATQSRVPLDDVKASIGALLIVCGIFFMDRKSAFPGYWALLPVLGTYLVISSGGARVNRFLAHPGLVYVGLISYPLYLWHWPLLSFLRITESGEPSAPVKLAVIALSFLLAWLTYQLIERPIRRSRFGLVPLSLGASVASVGLIGLLVFKHDGFAERVERVAVNATVFEWPDAMAFTRDCKYEWLRFTDVSHCLRTDPAKAPTVALLGDSHANMYFSGFSPHYAREGENLINLGKDGCAPFYDLEGQGSELKLKCAVVVNDVLDFALNRKSIKTVILTSRSPYLSAPDGSEFTERYAAAMRDTIGKLLKAGKQVTFIMDLPALDFDPKSCVDLRPLRLVGSQLRRPCGVSRAQAERDQAAYRRAMQAVLRELPGVTVLDPVTVLCDEEYCSAMRGGRMLYRDQTHLSVHGSALIGDRFAPRTKQAAR